MILAAIGTIHVSLLSQQRFQNSTLATVVESTIFPIYDIPFPAVTICNYNRVNYLRVPNVVDSYLPRENATIRQQLTNFLAILDEFEFGSFEQFVSFQQENVTRLDFINITELYRRVRMQMI